MEPDVCDIYIKDRTSCSGGENVYGYPFVRNVTKRYVDFRRSVLGLF